MYMSYPVPGRCRGSVVGTLLVWIVGALTLGGALFLWVVERPAPDPGSPAEIAARTAPVGHLTLAGPPAAVAASPGTPAAPSGGAGTSGASAAQAEQRSAPETGAGPAPGVAEVSSQTGSVALEVRAVEAVSAPVAEAPVVEVPTVDTTAAVATAPETADSGAGPSADQLPVAQQSSPEESGTAAADSIVEGAPDERPVAEGAESTAAAARPLASAPPLPAGAGSPPWDGSSPTSPGAAQPPSRRPFPMVPPDPYGYGPYRMVPIFRPDLPGAPYQLVPMAPPGR